MGYDLAIIGSGGSAFAAAIDGLTEAGYLTSTTAMELDRLPASMIVIGGGAVGLEQVQLWSRLGVEVSVVEMLERLAPSEEPEIGEALAEIFAREGIGAFPAAALTHIARDERGYQATLTDRAERQHTLRAERLLVATGRRPVTAGLNLDRVGVKTGHHGAVVVDAYLRTGNPRIWAAGDVTGHPQYVYVAAAHGDLGRPSFAGAHRRDVA